MSDLIAILIAMVLLMGVYRLALRRVPGLRRGSYRRSMMNVDSWRGSNMLALLSVITIVDSTNDLNVFSIDPIALMVGSLVVVALVAFDVPGADAALGLAAMVIFMGTVFVQDPTLFVYELLLIVMLVFAMGVLRLVKP